MLAACGTAAAAWSCASPVHDDPCRLFGASRRVESAAEAELQAHERGDTPAGARAWRCAADYYARDQRLLQSIAAYEQAHRIYSATGDHAGASTTAHLMFRLHYLEGDPLKALPHAERAYRAAMRTNDLDLATRAFASYFAVLHDLGDLPAAERLVRRAENSVPSDAYKYRSYIDVNRGTLHKNRGRPHLARNAYQRALQSAQRAQERPSLRAAHLNLVQVYLMIGNPDLAAKHLAEARQESLPHSRRPNSTEQRFEALLAMEKGEYAEAIRLLEEALSGKPGDLAWMMEHELGLAHEAAGDFAEASNAYGRSARRVEERRRSASSPELQHWVTEERRGPLESQFRLHAWSGRAKEALDVAERMKGRVFIEEFVRATMASEVSTSTVSELVSRVLEIQRLKSALDEVVSQSPGPDRPFGKALEGVNALVYVKALNELWIIYVRDGALSIHPATSEIDALAAKAEAFSGDLGSIRDAAWLGEVLVPPAVRPPPGTTLFIVTDGPVGRIPMAALMVEGRRLVEFYDIAYVPNLAAFILARTQEFTEPYTAPVVLAAAEELGQGQKEAEQVAKLLGVSLNIGDGATSQAFRGAARARVLHIVGHSGLLNGRAWLDLADGPVQASSILAWQLRPQMVFLASCESGARPGQQMWGSLGSAFLAAGARAVVAALWSIDDERARRFVERFYRGGGARRPLAVLSETQRSLIREGVSIREWAPYVLLGADR